MAEPLLALVGLPGWAEVALVTFFTLLLLGGRLPGLARSAGQAIIEFRNAVKGRADERNDHARTD